MALRTSRSASRACELHGVDHTTRAQRPTKNENRHRKFSPYVADSTAQRRWRRASSLQALGSDVELARVSILTRGLCRREPEDHEGCQRSRAHHCQDHRSERGRSTCKSVCGGVGPKAGGFVQPAVDIEPRDLERAMRLDKAIVDVLQTLEVAVLQHHLDQGPVDDEMHATLEPQAHLISGKSRGQLVCITGHVAAVPGGAEPPGARAAPPLVEGGREAAVLGWRRNGCCGCGDLLFRICRTRRRCRGRLVGEPIHRGCRGRHDSRCRALGLVHLANENIHSFRQSGEGVGQGCLHGAAHTLGFVGEVVRTVEVEDELREVHFLVTTLRAARQRTTAEACLAGEAIAAAERLLQLLTWVLLENRPEGSLEGRPFRRASEHREGSRDAKAIDLAANLQAEADLELQVALVAALAVVLDAGIPRLLGPEPPRRRGRGRQRLGQQPPAQACAGRRHRRRRAAQLEGWRKELVLGAAVGPLHGEDHDLAVGVARACEGKGRREAAGCRARRQARGGHGLTCRREAVLDTDRQQHLAAHLPVVLVCGGTAIARALQSEGLHCEVVRDGAVHICDDPGHFLLAGHGHLDGRPGLNEHA
mmetsp:Transcript_168526/g.541630  ORF Transcript_168526/g.541630 Transcript_168526/m.541630 type:complete len:592 (+) Transcript_168526:190-1965(+)